MFAPDEGSKTRQKIADGSASAKNTITSEATQLKEEVEYRAKN
ncbi:YtxH domain-containing protein [Tenacibaculum sediminilitoris]